MSNKKRPIVAEKTNLHPRNPHRNRYDFPALTKSLPELAAFVYVNEYEERTIDFKLPEAVKTLNRALLKYFYGITHWDIPTGYLCPPIPGRADYLHYAADLLASCNNETEVTGNVINVLDVGTGANCIYPLLGHKTFGWRFVGSDVDKLAVHSARNTVDVNSLGDVIEIREQSSPTNIFTGIIKPKELFDLTICNPPFHGSLKEAMEGNQRKRKNLGHRSGKETLLNFGGQNTELWCPGGEQTFLNKMIIESKLFADNSLWFTSLVSKQTTLAGCYKSLDWAGAFDVRTISMSQGQKVSRILAWTFLDKTAQIEWRDKRWK